MHGQSASRLLLTARFPLALRRAPGKEPVRYPSHPFPADRSAVPAFLSARSALVPGLESSDPRCHNPRQHSLIPVPWSQTAGRPLPVLYRRQSPSLPRILLNRPRQTPNQCCRRSESLHVSAQLVPVPFFPVRFPSGFPLSLPCPSLSCFLLFYFLLFFRFLFSLPAKP